jgi:formate--tetrahydrofolate ligase
LKKSKQIAKRIYRADEVLADAENPHQLKEWEAAGYPPARLYGENAI